MDDNDTEPVSREGVAKAPETLVKSLKELLESFGADIEEFPQIEDTPPRAVHL